MTDVRTEFLRADYRQRLNLATSPDHQRDLLALLGTEALAGYQHAAARRDSGHLSVEPPANIVFVPGVMGSILASQGRGGIWWIDVRSRQHINDLRLAPDGLTDADARAQVEPVTADLTYEGFFDTVWATSDLRHVAFAYDWRKPLTASAARFAQVVERTRQDNGGRPVHVVAHSMGGLLVRAALARLPKLWESIDKIVFIATPHYGSPAISGYLKNHLWGFNLMALLGHYLDRTTFRSLWGVLSLLPAPAGVYPRTRNGGEHPCANFDLYDAAAWRLDLDATATAALQTVLDGAAALHRELYTAHLALDQERRDRMTVIAGVGYDTLFRTAYKPVGGFLWTHMDRVTSRQPGNPDRDGDGRVPTASANLEYVGQTRYARGRHADLPSIPEVSRAVVDYLAGGPLALSPTPTGALGGHLGDGTAVGDDPGYLNLDPPPEASLAALAADLEDDQLPAFGRLSIL